MKKSIEKMTVSAVLVALATVLSMIPLGIKLPFGGSLTLLSMLPIITISARYGIGWGTGSAFIYSIIQYAIDGFALNWGLTAGVWVICTLFDYVLPFTLLGLSGAARSRGKAGIIGGAAVTIALRFLCHFVTGVTIWRSGAAEAGFDSATLYSLCYNGVYMLPELIFTVAAVIVVLAVPQGRRLMCAEK